MTELLAPPLPQPRAGEREEPVATRRRYAVCPPDHFAVVSTINVWMDPSVPVDRDRAAAQWQAVVDAHRAHGHEVVEVPALPGQPDMVFAANGGLVVGGTALLSRFRHAERRGEEPAWRAAYERAGLAVVPSEHPLEGEGDLLVLGPGAGAPVLAGCGPRTDVRAHAQVAAVTGREVVTLELVDPRWYHLDTAVGVVDRDTVVVVPQALSAASLARLQAAVPRVLALSEHDALAFGANLVSDGRRVLLEAEATRLADDLAALGYEPVPLDTTELRKSGGSVKCVTAEWV